MVKLSVLKEFAQNEKRAALVPESLKKLTKLGVSVLVEEGTGLEAGFKPQDYIDAGAKITSNRDEVLGSNLILGVRLDLLDSKELDKLKKSILVGFFNPFNNIKKIDLLASKNFTSFSMELIPRISRAQRMDALSAMSSAAGYKAVLLGANSLNKFFPLMMTAAGTISPSKILIIGAGVAGLQAIATAKRLGAQVKAFDTRPIVKEQVESLGAEFIELETTDDAETTGGYAEEMSDDFYKHEQEIIAKYLTDSDVVITTAQIFGKKSPLLITGPMVESMRSGSVIVDLAAENGGNCSYTELNKTVVKNGVIIHGFTDLPSTLSYHASEMLSRNISALLFEIIKDGEIKLDLDDEIISSTLLTHKGKIINQYVKKMIEKEK